jgi:hypothetical protein
MFKKYFPLVFISILWSCGAASDESSVTRPTDTISSSAKVRFNSQTVTVLSADSDPQSDVFEVCTFSMSPITGNLPFELEDQNTLLLGSGTFTYKRPLKSPKTAPGVDDRVFAVWAMPDVTTEGVTLSLEVEVEPELLTFRMICTG